ncbi:hypothetical protein WL93_29100 [Burkholderia diffusa]|uniref:hypothetical protein n=1 Tax=Burkholderia diffusa TaxID=488732 RepID=UPI000751CE1D|nr:hypothetical protein [Burkholderia diffusa]KVC23529.1 hypothetical protein WI69_02190 [Burkholderia diffusa]KVH46935.1 hypothetical protein WJ39_16810 [Burkholderia diffusa]KVN00496.1 hypothetical protein WJ62_15840 [Burkholderia diffusa]KWF75853.1 hypothetical protein WL93_29100 [Burkholderia diffusa]
MTEKHRAITGFRIAKPVARRSRTLNGNLPVRLWQLRQLIDKLAAREHHHGQAHVASTSAVEHDARAVGTQVVPPQRKVFDVGPIDRSKSTLRVISMADAQARCRRETLLHFGLDPDL